MSVPLQYLSPKRRFQYQRKKPKKPSRTSNSTKVYVKRYWVGLTR